MKRDNEEMGKDIQTAQKIFQASQMTNQFYYPKLIESMPLYENIQSMELFKKMQLMPVLNTKPT